MVAQDKRDALKKALEMHTARVNPTVVENMHKELTAKMKPIIEKSKGA